MAVTSGSIRILQIDFSLNGEFRRESIPLTPFSKGELGFTVPQGELVWLLLGCLISCLVKLNLDFIRNVGFGIIYE
jgi:hypothetical protein